MAGLVPCKLQHAFIITVCRVMITTNKITVQRGRVIAVVGILTSAFNQYLNCSTALKDRFAFTKHTININNKKLG